MARLGPATGWRSARGSATVGAGSATPTGSPGASPGARRWTAHPAGASPRRQRRRRTRGRRSPPGAPGGRPPRSPRAAPPVDAPSARRRWLGRDPDPRPPASVAGALGVLAASRPGSAGSRRGGRCGRRGRPEGRRGRSAAPPPDSAPRIWPLRRRRPGTRRPKARGPSLAFPMARTWRRHRPAGRAPLPARSRLDRGPWRASVYSTAAVLDRGASDRAAATRCGP